jgi:CheY-like chemotaxis protein
VVDVVVVEVDVELVEVELVEVEVDVVVDGRGSAFGPAGAGVAMATVTIAASNPERAAVRPSARGTTAMVPHGSAAPAVRGPGRPLVRSEPMPVTILVVDDDPVILQLLQVNFELEGFRVLTAADGESALAQAREQRPAVIVTDVMMPRMSGIELLETLRADPVTSAIPVVLLTAKAQQADIQGGREAGADDYITKPFDPLDLVERVNRLVIG